MFEGKEERYYERIALRTMNNGSWPMIYDDHQTQEIRTCFCQCKAVKKPTKNYYCPSDCYLLGVVRICISGFWVNTWNN